MLAFKESIYHARLWAHSAHAVLTYPLYIRLEPLLNKNGGPNALRLIRLLCFWQALRSSSRLVALLARA